MYRDPSEFRERFKAYKEGKSVREIYGLPGYAGGKSSSAVDDTADFLRLYEGFKEKTYLDGKGIPTIGYGFTDAKFVNKGRITRAEAEAELKRQIAVRLAELRRKLGPQVWDSLSNDSKKALTSYHFNYPAGFKDNTKFMLYWRAGRYSDAIKEVDAGWNDPDNPGLRTRRIAEQKLLRSDPALFSRPIPEKPSDVTILRPDVLRVATTIPQEKTIPITDPRNATIAEALRAMWAHAAFENMPKVSDMPIWESPSLSALTPVDYDVTPLRTYAGGKLPGYQDGYILKGHKQIPIDDLGGWARHHDADEDYKTTYWKNVVGSGIDFVEGITNHWRRILNGRGTVDDAVDATIDVATGAAGKVVKDSAKRLIKNTKRAVKKTIKPTKASVKKPTMSAPEVAEYHKANPKLVKPVSVTPEVLKAVDYTYDRANRLSKEPLEKVNLNMQSAKFPENTNISAYATPYGTVFDEAYIKEMQKMGIMVPHEYEHLLQQQIKYTPEQASILEQAFPFSSDWLQAHKDFDLLKERGAMNSELAYAIGKKYGFPVGKQFDNVVKKMPNSELEEIASGLSAYNKHSSELRMARPNVWPDVPSPNPAWNPLVRALTKVPATITVPLIAESQLDEYKDGKISINPANRGKFNATKKRTGKTTEELTHSKNPLTRKRAIFALNARKWHHANGKLPRYGDGIIGDIVDAYDKFVETDPYNIATMMSFLPIIGTGMDIREAVKNPTAENIGYATLSGITDVVGGRIFAKLAGTAMKAKKAAKAARKAEYEFWKDTPFILNKPKAEAKRTLKFYMDRAADNAYNNVVSDPTFRVPGFEIAAGLGAGYGLDFVANINLHKQNK